MKIIKYVISYHGIPLLFCSNILHSSVINTAISAGFVIVNYNVELGIFTIKCFGGSDSLKLNMRFQDNSIIQE